MASSLTPRKRPLPVEFEDVSSVSTTTDGPAAKIHGMITALSPIKPTSSKPYFEGYLSDGSKKMRFVGFSAAKEKLISRFNAAKEPVVMSNCTIKNARFGDAFEIILGDSSTVQKSTKEFDVASDEHDITTLPTLCTKAISLDELSTQEPYQRVTVQVKVIDIGDVINLDDGRVVQNTQASDSNAIVKVALWQDFVNSLVLGKSYRLINFAVKKFDSQVSLFTPKQDAKIEEIDDIKDAIQACVQHTKTVDAEVIAVTDLTLKRTCVSCRKGQILPVKDTPLLGTCTVCNATVVVDGCPTKLSAMLTVKSNTFSFKLLASGKHLTCIANVENLHDVTTTSLLLSPLFTATYTINNMSITNISRL